MSLKKTFFWGLGGLVFSFFAEVWALWARFAPYETFEIHYTTEHMLVTVGIFILLFLWLGISYEKGRRQPKWLQLIRGRNWKELIPEIVVRLLMSVQFFLIFWLLTNQTISGDEFWEFVPLSMILGYIWGVCTTEGKAKKPIAVCAYVFLAFYTIHHLYMSGKTLFTHIPFDFGIFYDVKLYIELVGTVLILPALRKNYRAGVLFLVSNILLYQSYKINGVSTSFYFTGFIFLSTLFFSPRTTKKVMLGTMLTYTASLAIFLALNWVENRAMARHGGVYYTLGMVHTNSTAMMIANITLLIWILWFRRRPWWTLVLFTGMAAIVRYVTDCRTVMISLAAFGILHLLYCLLLKIKKEKGLMALIPVYLICTLVCFFMIGQVNALNGKVDGSFLIRFSGPARAMTDYPLQLFGTGVNPNNYPGMENNYMNTIIRDGIVPFGICIGLMTWMMYRFYKNRQYDEMVVMTYYAIYAFMENLLFTCYWNFGVLLCFSFVQSTHRERNLPEPVIHEIKEKETLET